MGHKTGAGELLHYIFLWEENFIKLCR